MLNLGNVDEAVDAYDRSVATDSTYVYGLKMAVLARVLNEDFSAALIPARRLAALGGQDAETAAAHGIAAEKTGLIQEAVEAYQRGAALDSTRLDWLEHAAGLQLFQKDYRGAETDFRRLIKMDQNRLRLGEVTGLIDRVISAQDRQGKNTASLVSWRQQVAARLAGFSD